MQATLGHASVATTGRYLHARPTDSSARYLGVKLSETVFAAPKAPSHARAREDMPPTYYPARIIAIYRAEEPTKQEHGTA